MRKHHNRRGPRPRDPNSWVGSTCQPLQAEEAEARNDHKDTVESCANPARWLGPPSGISPANHRRSSATGICARAARRGSTRPQMPVEEQFSGSSGRLAKPFLEQPCPAHGAQRRRPRKRAGIQPETLRRNPRRPRERRAFRRIFRREPAGGPTERTTPRGGNQAWRGPPGANARSRRAGKAGAGELAAIAAV